MRYAGITWWRNNYGSVLQAYALQELINSFSGIDYEILCQYGRTAMSFENFILKLKRTGFKETFSTIIFRFGLKRLRIRAKKIQSFIDLNLKISNKVYSRETLGDANAVYDGFICGSDQIWNPMITNYDDMYWLGFADAKKKKIAYAPSLGTEVLDDSGKSKIHRYLEDFSAISCRERKGSLLINSILTDDSCKDVLDPTLVLDRELWDAMSSPRVIQGKYIFSYLLQGNFKQRQAIEKFAKKKGMKLVSIPFLESRIHLYDFVYGDEKCWALGPDEFISAIRYAEYVFTDSYHCCIFSSLYHREFFVFPKNGRIQMLRIEDLLEKLEIYNRIMYDDMIDEKKSGGIKWENVDCRIKLWKEKSFLYLKDAVYS